MQQGDLKRYMFSNREQYDEEMTRLRKVRNEKLNDAIKAAAFSHEAFLMVGAGALYERFSLFVDNVHCNGDGAGTPAGGAGTFWGTLYVYVDSLETLITNTKTFEGDIELFASAGMTLIGKDGEALARFQGGGVSTIPWVVCGGTAEWVMTG